MTWLTPAARRLLDLITIERPVYSLIKRDDWTNQVAPHFRGSNARQLRQIWKDALGAAMTANDRDLYVALHGQNPDDLIARELDKALPSELKRTGTGGYWS